MKLGNYPVEEAILHSSCEQVMKNLKPTEVHISPIDYINLILGLEKRLVTCTLEGLNSHAIEMYTVLGKVLIIPNPIVKSIYDEGEFIWK